MSEMVRADCLVSIGNKLYNQMASKTIEYIATGKPILHITQVTPDPSVQRLQKYDYAFTVQKDEWDAEKLMEFVRTCKGKRTDFEILRERYREATPEFVAQQLLEILSSGGNAK